MSLFSRLIHPAKAGSSPLRSDRTLLLWLLICISTLGSTVALMIMGVFDTIGLEQIRLLGGHPFYIDAAAAQISLLSPTGIFAICTIITLYLSIVLLRCSGFAKRTHICVLAALAVCLPGFLCILWDGVLLMAAPLYCIILLWFLLAFLPALLSLRSKT